jgi:hypothetical protein
MPKKNEVRADMRMMGKYATPEHDGGVADIDTGDAIDSVLSWGQAQSAICSGEIGRKAWGRDLVSQ